MKPQANYPLWKDDAEQGPYTIEQLRAMWNAGAITSQTQFMMKGGSVWLPLSNIADKIENQTQFYCYTCQQSIAPKVVANEFGNAFFYCPLCGDQVWSNRARAQGIPEYAAKVDGVTSLVALGFFGFLGWLIIKWIFK